jgi:hypothetical protein
MSVGRFLVFIGCSNPSGGWNDFRGVADTLEDAIALAKENLALYKYREYGGWWHVVDTALTDDNGDWIADYDGIVAEGKYQAVT